VAAGKSGSGGRIRRRRPGAREEEGQVGGVVGLGEDLTREENRPTGWAGDHRLATTLSASVVFRPAWHGFASAPAAVSLEEPKAC